MEAKKIIHFIFTFIFECIRAFFIIFGFMFKLFFGIIFGGTITNEEIVENQRQYNFIHNHDRR